MEYPTGRRAKVSPAPGRRSKRTSTGSVTARFDTHFQCYSTSEDRSLSSEAYRSRWPLSSEAYRSDLASTSSARRCRGEGIEQFKFESKALGISKTPLWGWRSAPGADESIRHSRIGYRITLGRRGNISLVVDSVKTPTTRKVYRISQSYS